MTKQQYDNISENLKIEREILKSNVNINGTEKFNLLYVPTNSREVAQFDLVRREFKDPLCNIITIALDNDMEKSLKEKEFQYKHINDYKSLNLLNIIKKENPDIIVTDFCGPIPNALINAANYLGIPTLQIDDGIINDHSAFWDVPLWQPYIYILKGIVRGCLLQYEIRPYFILLTTLFVINNPLEFLKKYKRELIKCTNRVPRYAEGLNIAVISAFAKKAYVQMGVPPEKIFITGQPRFDSIHNKKFNRDELKAELKVPENKHLAVLATQPLVGFIWTEKDNEKFIEMVCNAVRKIPKTVLVIKIHPVESIELYQMILKNIKEDSVIVCQDIELYELLNACDILMTVHSTVALEAMIFDKPVITINLMERPDVFPYAESGAAIGVYRKENLVEAIRNSLFDGEIKSKLAEKRKKFVYEHAYLQDGKASKRVADLIIQLIQKNKE